MSLKIHIADPATGLSAQVVDGVYPHGLVVATRPLTIYDNSIRFFSNDLYGSNMNVDGAFGGTPEKIHDGIDSILWTATDIVAGARTTFNSTDQNHTVAGVSSIKVDDTAVGGVYQIAKGSPMIMPNYTALTMWVYVEKDWKAGDIVEIYGWDTALGVQVGVALDLKDYFNYLDYGSWHKITISLTDLEVSGSLTLDSLRVRQVASEGKAPKYYLDDIQFEQVGTPAKYEVRADKGTWLHIDSFAASFVAAIPSTLLNATMPYLSYDTILGATLISGVTYKREQKGKTILSLQLNDLMDFLQLPEARLTTIGSDGTNTFIKLDQQLTAPIILKPEDDDILSYTISDDLTSLLHMRISIGARVEQR
jgi:hypothetical protein